MSDCDCLSNVGRQTPCECNGPGWCKRHSCEKNSHFYGLCANRIEYFTLYEQGNGPCIGVHRHPNANPRTTAITGRRIGLGDVAGWLFSRFGIKAWPGCGCDKRKEWLNRVTIWGWWRRA